MKKQLFLVLVICIVSVLFTSVNMFAQTKSTSGKNKVEVKFTYTKQKGFSSNQFAVWIEDAQGRYVKTLYATKFTATGGWKKRDLALPLWVKKSNLAGMNKAQIDAITSSTPKNGNLSYVWDGTDSAGKVVPSGEYKVFVEATLRNENIVVYTATVKPGEKSQTTAQAKYSGPSTEERGMIGSVTVVCN